MSIRNANYFYSIVLSCSYVFTELLLKGCDLLNDSPCQGIDCWYTEKRNNEFRYEKYPVVEDWEKFKLKQNNYKLGFAHW